MKSASVFALSSLLLSGCASTLLRHYETIEPSTTLPQIQLSVFVANPKASESSPLISGLGERAQAELIRTVAAKMEADSKPEDLLALLRKIPDEPEKSCAWATKISSTRKLVLTVLGDLRLPADRLDKLDVTFELNNANGDQQRAKFMSWDHFDSAYGKFDIGTAKFTQSGKISVGRENTGVANLPSAAGSVTNALKLGAEANNTLEESAAYSLRRMSIGGALTPTSARLVQEGGPNINLFGSSVATLTVSLTPNDHPVGVYSFGLKKNQVAVAPADVRVQRCHARFPRSSKAIAVTVRARALLRQVNTGDGTVSEGDDNVTLKVIELTPDPRDLELLSEADLKFERYALAHCTQGQKLDDCSRLNIERSGLQNNSVEGVLLPTMDEAINLRTWLVDQTRAGVLSSIGGLAIGLTGKGASTADGMSAAELKGLSKKEAAQLRVVLEDVNK